MTIVYKWPPVGAISREWTQVAPVGRSKSLITGAEFVSAAQRRRRVAQIEVTSLFSPHGAGAGYMEALKRYLDGGVNLVRLDYYKPPTCQIDVTDEQRGKFAFGWRIPPEGFIWTTPPDGFDWTAGLDFPYILTTDAGVPAIRVFRGPDQPGLPPNALVALPGEFVSILIDGVWSQYMIAAPAFTNFMGVVTIRLTSAPPAGGRVSIGSRDTGVFKADEMPRAVQPASGDWSYSWSFTEVFEDERGPFEEVNPWS